MLWPHLMMGTFSLLSCRKQGTQTGLMAQHSAPLTGHGDSQAPCTGCKQWRVLNAAGRGSYLSESGTLELKQVKIK